MSTQPDRYFEHRTIDGGLILRIPVLEEEETDDAGLPPWKRQNPDYGA